MQTHKVSIDISAFRILIDSVETHFSIVHCGPRGWAVMDNSFVLSRLHDPVTAEEAAQFCVEPGQNWLFEWQPQPSSRDEEFYQRTHVHEVERLEERLLAFQAFVPLASDLNHRTLAVDLGVDEVLHLNAVPLQIRLRTTPDTKLNGLGELGSNHHIVLIFPSIQHVIAFHPKNVWQENRITRSDSCVLERSTR